VYGVFDLTRMAIRARRGRAVRAEMARQSEAGSAFEGNGAAAMAKAPGD